jgi:acetyltransferase
MKTLFFPKSIAVFGVSESKTNFGRSIVKNLIDFHFEGEIYAIGQKPGQVYGLPIHTSIMNVPGTVESAIFLIPAQTIPPLLEECGQKGVRRAIISSGGFSEFSADRKGLENQVAGIAERYGIRFIGPNCLGVINQDNGMCLPFVRMSRFPTGPVALMTQSGGVGLSLINNFTGNSIGINKYVSLGNKLNVDEGDIIEFLETDESTKMMCLYLEEIERGRRFMDAVRKTTKPVIVYKANTTASGAKMAASHTAAVANDDAVVDAAMRQVGVVRAHGLLEMAVAANAFKMPPMNGNRVAVITPTGGHAVICADECERLGLELPAFPQKLVEDVEKHVRAGVIKLQNPMDLGDMFDFEMYATIVLRLLQEPTIDALMLSFIFLDNIPGGTIGNIFPMMKKLMHDFKKPIALCVAGNANDVNRIRANNDFPIFESPEQAIQALAMLRRHHERVARRADQPEIIEFDRAAVQEIIDNALDQGRTELTSEAADILKCIGVPMIEDTCAADAAAAAKAAADLGFPVVLKIDSPDILHKTEAGGVALNLQNEVQVREAFASITASAKEKFPDANIRGVTIQKMVSNARELLLGVNTNEQFGPVVVFGVGGIFVEAFKDITMRIAPLTRNDALDMLDGIRAKNILDEFRGMAAANREKLVELLLKLSSLVTSCPRIRELDINPLLVPADGESMAAADARMVISAR